MGYLNTLKLRKRSLLAAQRPAHQPPRAHHNSYQNTNDLAREAVGCMGVFGGASPYLLAYQENSHTFTGVRSVN